jgi:hypothetical protein
MDSKQDDRLERLPLLPCLFVIALFAVATAIFAGLGVTVGWQTYDQVRPVASKLSSANADKSSIFNTEYIEWIAAQEEHAKIVAISQECFPDGATKLDPAAFTIPLPGGYGMSGQSTVFPAPTALVEPGYLLAAIHLSTDIGKSRIDLAREQIFEDISMQAFTWVGVLVGVLTTVLVSVKSMIEGRKRIHFWIGVVAIVFAALGTAVAGLNSFYAPKVVYDRTTRSLATLRQLHAELATAITRESKVTVCQNWSDQRQNDWHYKRIKGLTEQYIAVVVAATQLITAPQPQVLDADDLDGSGNSERPQQQPIPARTVVARGAVTYRTH